MEKDKLNKIIRYYKIQNEEDILFKDNEAGREIFFDSFDVISLLQGVWALKKNISIDVKEFKTNRRLLIYAALERGWLGKVKLLKPHQDELILKLTSSSILFPSSSFDLEEIKLDFINRINLEEFLSKNKNDIKTYFETFSLDSEGLFKLNFLLNPIKWNDRFDKFDNSLFQLEQKDFSYEDFQRKPIFSLAKEILDSIKPEKIFLRSNYFDAIAIAELQDKLDCHIQNPKLPFPIFYASTKKISMTLSRIFETTGFLKILRNGQEIPVFRHTEFFLIDLVFNALNDTKFTHYINDIDKLKNNVKSIYSDLEDEILSSEKTTKIIQDQININFYEKIWFDTNGYEEIKNTFRIVKSDAAGELNENLVKETINTQKEYLKSKFDSDILYIRNVNKLWKEIQDIKYESFKALLPENGKINPFTDFALTRFPVSDDACEKIDSYINELATHIDNDEEDGMSLFQSSLVNGLSISLTAKEINDDHISLYILLWIMGKYDLIYNLSALVIGRLDLMNKSVGKLNLEEICFLSIVGAASPLCVPPKTEKLESIILKLKSNIQGPTNYKVNIIISYLNFQLWKTYSHELVLPELLTEKKRINIAKYDYILLEALNYAEKAKTKLEDLVHEDHDKHYRKRKYYYVINQIIYYNTIGSERVKFEKVEQYLWELISIQQVPYLWQGRFWDTFGWYYLRKAIINKNDPDKFKRFLEKSKLNNEKCFLHPNTDREIRIYNSLKNAIELMEKK